MFDCPFAWHVQQGNSLNLTPCSLVFLYGNGELSITASPTYSKSYIFLYQVIANWYQPLRCLSHSLMAKLTKLLWLFHITQLVEWFLNDSNTLHTLLRLHLLHADTGGLMDHVVRLPRTLLSRPLCACLLSSACRYYQTQQMPPPVIFSWGLSSVLAFIYEGGDGENRDIWNNVCECVWVRVRVCICSFSLYL